MYNKKANTKTKTNKTYNVQKKHQEIKNAWSAIAHLQLRLGQYSQALDVLNEHVQRRPEDTHARQLRDAVAQRLGFVPGAVEA